MPDVPAYDLARIDALTARLKISRTEHCGVCSTRWAAHASSPVTTADLQQLASRFSDLEDPEVMRQAWW
jgi:hypothetical protein